MEKQMQKAVENFRSELASLRTGRASIALLEGIKVLYYGSQMALNQVGHISIPEARTIEIKPWDPTVLPEIEKAIQKSDLGVNPNNDGNLIRINIPKLNEDRRKDLVKKIKKISEEYRVSVRNERREALELIKKSEKEKSISEDDRKTAEHEIQKITDTLVKKIDEICSHKEKEIMEV
ncbi:MAG: ribosome recycling factor [bacterium]